MNKEIKIGLVGLLSIIVLFVGINYLKGLNVLDSSRDFYAIYDDIGGLKPGSAVSFNGYQVGMVSKINLSDVRFCSAAIDNALSSSLFVT